MRIANWFCLGLYALLMLGIVWGVVAARRQVLAQADAERAEWRRYEPPKPASSADSIEARAQRERPTADEPPMLIMMRDRFALMLGATIVFTSMIFGFLAFVIRGIAKPREHP